MLLLVRMSLTLIVSFFRSRISVVDETVTSHRVWFNDSDIYRHLNNGRYLSVMDLGRLDLFVRMGLLRPVLRRKWYPVVGSATIRFVRSIDLLQRYQIRTRTVCWDEKWFFIEQRFEREGRLMAVGLVKGVFLGPEGKISPAQLVGLAGNGLPSPPMPDRIRAWADSDSAGSRL